MQNTLACLQWTPKIKPSGARLWGLCVCVCVCVCVWGGGGGGGEWISNFIPNFIGLKLNHANQRGSNSTTSILQMTKKVFSCFISNKLSDLWIIRSKASFINEHMVHEGMASNTTPTLPPHIFIDRQPYNLVRLKFNVCFLFSKSEYS